jgi:ABC-2 type transport system ATP-binding protein
MAAPDIVRVEQVSKRFVLHKDRSIKERLLNFSINRRHSEVFWALRDISLTIASGSTVGLIGPNGSGKSTLLKIIGGIIDPTSGTVSRRGRLAALLELGAGFHPDLTGRENVYLNAAILGLSQRETRSYFDQIVDFSGIEGFIDSPVKFYSSGMYVRLAFAVAVHVDPDLLLIDEVLAVGDEAFQAKCMDKIAEFQAEGRTIVFVSHSADQVADICKRVLVLNHGSLVFDGATAEGVKVLREGFAAEG